MHFRRDHHYVPRSHLKHWAREDGRIWTYRLLVPHSKVPIWKEKSTRGVAYQAHLYTRVVASGETDEIERWFATDFEDPADESVRKVVEEARLAPSDWETLVRFLAAQDLRTPANLIASMSHLHETLQKVLPGALRESVRKLETAKREGRALVRPRAGAAESFPVRVTTRIAPGAETGFLKAEAVVGRSMWLYSLRHSLTNSVRFLDRHRWTVLKPPEGMNWVTSDNPVVRLNNHAPGNYDFGGGWGRRGTEIFMPLSPHHLLYTQVGAKPPARGTRLSRSKAWDIQRVMIEHAHRLIFATNADPQVSETRPRVVDDSRVREEAEQWRRWHSEQTEAERALFRNPPSEA